MQVLGMVTRGIRNLEACFSYLGVALLLGMMVLGSADVISRNIFYVSITGSIEWSQLMQAGIVLLGWSYVQATNSHLKVDIVYRRFPPLLKKAVNIFILLLIIFFFALLLWYSMEIVISDFHSGRQVATILVPVWPFKMLVPVGSFFVIVECLIQLYELLFKKKEEVNGLDDEVGLVQDTGEGKGV